MSWQRGSTSLTSSLSWLGFLVHGQGLNACLSAVATAGWSRICGRFFQDHGIASEQMIYLHEFFSEGKSSVYGYQDIYNGFRSTL
jgi:hypothetical protein